MQINDVVKVDDQIFRILAWSSDNGLAIDCHAQNMPSFFPHSFFARAQPTTFPFSAAHIEDLSPERRRIAYQRYAMIAPALAVLDAPRTRSQMISQAAEIHGISKQTIRTYLCAYLVYQNISILAPKERAAKELTDDQKNIRWALNKFYYTQRKNSLPTAYAMMLKAKYCDAQGTLLAAYPSYNQFRHFYRKTYKAEKHYISRDGIKHYQRNHRPLIGDGVQAFAPNIGTAMLDSTICDIYLVNGTGQLIGRPVLVVACDANTSLCLGYSLLWEGGTYSLQQLMLNILEDKQTLCHRMGIPITPEQWPVKQLPGVMVTDGGSEYTGQTFSQITDLGVSLVQLPPYRPDLKGPVEKLFDLIQSSYKDILKGKGVIMPDYQERGARDYRKDAILTMEEFERIVVRCIVYHNSARVLRNYPYSPAMLENKVPPYPCDVWNWKKKEAGANLITVSKRELVLTLLPRTTGKFTRFGLKVNKLRYYADGYNELFLQGGSMVVAYNPDDCSKVWVREKDGIFVEFELIEARFAEMAIGEVQEIHRQQKQLVNDSLQENYQAKIELMNFIETVATKDSPNDVQINGSRSARKSARKKTHKDIGGMLND